MGERKVIVTNMGTLKRIDQGEFYFAASIPGATLVVIVKYDSKPDGGLQVDSHTFHLVCASKSVPTGVMREMPVDQESRAQVTNLSVKRCKYVKLPNSSMSRRMPCFASCSTRMFNGRKFGMDMAINVAHVVAAWLVEGASVYTSNPRMVGKPLTSMFAFADCIREQQVGVLFEMTGSMADSITSHPPRLWTPRTSTSEGQHSTPLMSLHSSTP